MDHRRINAEPARQLSHRLLSLKRFKRNLRLKLGRVLFPF
jgi:hypothetical protein